jgi:hypothetical protein
MSKIAVSSPASGTATYTISAPAGSTDRTITLPDSSGTMATTESTLSQFNVSGSAPVYACRAWVNFNGTGTVAIRASGNVSSITDNATGLYTVNFTTSMPDTNYAVVGSAGLGSAIVTRLPAPGSTVTASSVQVDSTDVAQSVRVDISSYSVTIFR